VSMIKADRGSEEQVSMIKADRGSEEQVSIIKADRGSVMKGYRRLKSRNDTELCAGMLETYKGSSNVSCTWISSSDDSACRHLRSSQSKISLYPAPIKLATASDLYLLTLSLSLNCC
jgi:hypothetical protein